MKYDVVIVASGKGKRAKLGFNKVLFKMHNNKTVIENTLDIFFNDKDCKNVILVTSEKININNKKLIITKGGKERKDSVLNGLNLVNSEYCMIHDGARPFVSIKEINKLKKALKTTDACILGLKATDTVKYVKDSKIIETLNRDNIYLALTPQAFKSELLKEAYDHIKKNKTYTDDASIVEAYGYKVSIIEGLKTNIKLTTPEDFKNI